jgi:hypothetical protein
MALNALAVLLILGQLGACIPVPQDIGSDLTILINNDLLGERIKLNRSSSADLAVIKGPESPSADSGLILLTSRSREAAAADCAALGEQLWEPGLKTASIQPNLDYLTYENKYRSSQQYWIAPDASRSRVIDGEGNIKVSQPSSQFASPLHSVGTLLELDISRYEPSMASDSAFKQ